MSDRQILGLLACALGIALIAARRGAHWWQSNAWRMGDELSSWFAGLLERRVVEALNGLTGIALLGLGLWALLSPG